MDGREPLGHGDELFGCRHHVAEPMSARGFRDGLFASGDVSAGLRRCVHAKPLNGAPSREGASVPGEGDLDDRFGERVEVRVARASSISADSHPGGASLFDQKAPQIGGSADLEDGLERAPPSRPRPRRYVQRHRSLDAREREQVPRTPLDGVALEGAGGACLREVEHDGVVARQRPRSDVELEPKRGMRGRTLEVHEVAPAQLVRPDDGEASTEQQLDDASAY